MPRFALFAAAALSLAACADPAPTATSPTTNVGAESGPRVTGGGAGGATATGGAQTFEDVRRDGAPVMGGGTPGGNMGTGTPTAPTTRSRN